MENNSKIRISRHAIERFYERFGEQLLQTLPEEGRLEYAEEFIRQMWSRAVYISDDENGIMFRDYYFKCNIIVQNRTIITIVELKK